MRDDLRRMALFTSGLAEITRHRAEELVRSWVKTGDATREQAGAMAHDLMEWSRQNRKELLRLVRTEIDAQVTSFGLATKQDLERLERKVERLEAVVARASNEAARAARKASSRAKKTTRKKSAGRSTARGTSSSGPRSTPSPDDGTTSSA